MTQEHNPTAHPDAETGGLELDTGGHSVLNAEFSNAVIRDRQREYARHARDAAHRHEFKKPGRSLRSRLLGR